MAGIVTTDWSGSSTHDGDDLDIQNLDDEDAPCAPQVQRGWKTAFAYGQLKVTAVIADPAACDFPNNSVGLRKKVTFEYYTDTGDLLGESVAQHITSSVSASSELLPSGTVIGNQVTTSDQGDTCVGKFTGPHLHWTAPGILRGPARTSEESDPDTRPDVWAKPGLWDDFDTSESYPIDAVDPETDLVAVLIEPD